MGKEEFKNTQAFASKGKVRLFGLGNRTKGLLAAGILSVASLVPQTAHARPSSDLRKAGDIVSIVAGGVNALGGVVNAVSARSQQAEIETAMNDLVAQYQAEIQKLNEEYAAYTQEGGYTDQATALQVKRFMARNEAIRARAEGKKDVAQAYENRAAAYAKRAVAMDSILSAYANKVKPAKDGFYHEDDITTFLETNREKIDEMRLKAEEKKASQIRAQYNQSARKLAQLARQNKVQLQTATWQTIMGTNVILGSSFDLYRMNHHGPHHHGGEHHQEKKPAPAQSRGRDGGR